MRAGLDSAIESGIDVIVLARIPSGSYAGKWRSNMARGFDRKLVEDLLEEEVVVVTVEAGVADAIYGQGGAPHPDRDMASGQDAAANPTREMASGQDQPDIEPSTALIGSASGQISIKSSLAVHCARRPVVCDGEPTRNARRRIDERISNRVAAEHSVSDCSRPGMARPHRMPRGALCMQVILPWITDEFG